MIRPRCDNILRWRIKLIFIYHVYAKGDCAKCDMHTGAKSYFSSFVFNLHWNRNTFFIIKVTTVRDHRYLEKRINIVGCWCILSTQWAWWVKFFCWPWEDSLPDDKKVQRSNRKALSFHGSKTINSLTCMVIWSASRWLGDEFWHGRPVALTPPCSTVNSVLLQGEFREYSLSGVYNIVLGFSVLL